MPGRERDREQDFGGIAQKSLPPPRGDGGDDDGDGCGRSRHLRRRKNNMRKVVERQHMFY